MSGYGDTEPSVAVDAPTGPRRRLHVVAERAG